MGIQNSALQAIDVLELLADLFAERGSPDYIHADSGPEFSAILYL